MKRKGKILLAVLAAILLVVGIALYQVLANLDSIVARVIEEQGSEATGTAVTVDGVTIDLGAGRGTIAGLEVANPPDFSDRPAIAFEEITLSIDPLAATASPIVIREVAVSGANVLLEQTAAGNNLRTLQQALQQPAPDEGDGGGPGIVIERFVLQDAQVRVEVPQLDESRQAGLRRIELTDIGRASNGATATEVARQIVAPIMRAALESAVAEGVRNQLQPGLDDAQEKVTEKLLEKLPSPEE